jgi:mannan endo-1,4-beta-mannosidase
MADFLPYIDWPRFQRRTLTGALKVGPKRVESFGCSDAQQAILYFIRRDSLDSRGMVNPKAEPVRVTVDIPDMQSGHYRITAWSTRGGLIEQWDTPHFTHGSMSLVTPPVVDDVALAVTRRHS